MRFAYIDSHGNEVPIPSVDALALRIELGAIGPDTELYDAQADEWGPAKTHEIFHTLSRDSEDEGFVAPPPPVAPAPPPPGPAPPEPAAQEPESESASVEEVTQSAEDSAEEEFDLGLTLADPPPAPAEEAPPEQTAAETDLADLDLDLAPAAADEPGAGVGAELEDESLPIDEEPAPAEVAGSVEGQDGGFDFGDMSGGLELEQVEEATPEPSPGDFGGGMEIETEKEFTGPSEGLGEADDLQLEKPMSEFEPAAPPGWMEPDEPGGDDVMDFSTVSTEAVTEETGAATPEGAPAGQRRSPKDRPSPPKFKKQRSAAPIVLAVIVLALGVGGYVGWPILSARLAERNAPERPPVVMPTIPAELLPLMRSLAETAIAQVVEEVDRSTILEGAPTEPDQQWLAGVYFANASQYPGVEAFWSGIAAFVQGVREADWQAYHDRVVQLVEAEGLADDQASMVVERADSGFVAASQMREEAYAAMDRLVDAALDLHDFLLTNEPNIEYRPASTSTADPVLEAVPSTPEIGEQLDDMIDEVTDALDGALGSLARVNRPRLTAALSARLQEVGIE